MNDSYMARRSERAGNAALLSFIAPGLGQIYNGRWLWAIFWLIITPGFWVSTGGTLGWLCHVFASWQAYRQARG